MNKKNLDRNLVEAWEKGKPAELKRVRPSSSVLSIRVAADLFEELSKRAEKESKSVSVFARELIERGLVNDSPSTPAEIVTMFQKWIAETAQFTR